MKYIILFTILVSNNLYSQTQESIYERTNLAKSYIEAGLDQDAIEVYKSILAIQSEILGEHNIELVKVLFSLSDIYFNLNIPDSSKIYLNKALDIQYYNFLINQKKYIPTYERLKSVYSAAEDSNKVIQIDSLIFTLNDLDSSFLYFKKDSLITYPDIVSLRPNVIDSTSLVSDYSLNDKAVELINNGISLLNTGLYSESISYFDQAVKLNSNIVDLDYLISIEYGDSTQINYLIDALSETQYFDSTITTQSLFSAILFDKVLKPKLDIIELINNYIILYPNDIKGYLYNADIYFQMENYLDAMFYYYRVLRINPNYIKANLMLAKCLIKMNDYQGSIKLLSLVYDLDENNFDSKFHLGYSFYKLENYDQAIKEFTHALLLNANDANTYYYLGNSYSLINKKKQALESFNRAIRLDPYNGDAHFELGKIYEIVLKKKLALDHYKLADKYINSHDLNYTYGLLLYNEQLYRKAIISLRQFIIYEPENVEVLEILGDIFIKESRYPEAIDTYNRLIDKSPDISLYYINIAEAYYELGNYSMAKAHYQKALTLNEEDADILLRLGSICNLLYEYKNAQEYLNESISCGHTSKDLLFELGIAYGGQKKYLPALIALKEALNYSLDDPILHYQLGVIYREMFIFDLAILEYKIYLNTYRNDPIAYRFIGDSYMNLKNYQDAIINFRKASELYNDEDINTLYSLGKCYFYIEDFKESVRYYKSIIRIEHDFAEAHGELVKAYYALKKFKEAKKECNILFMLDRTLFNTIDYCYN